MDNILIGRYIQGNSWLHQLDPRTKLLGTILFLFIVFLANSPLTYAILSVFLLVCIYLSGLGIGYFIKGIKPMLWLIVFTGVFQMFFTIGGSEYFRIGIFALTEVGVISGLYIMLRFVIIIGMSTLLSLTTDPLMLADAIEHLMRPLKRVGVPVHEIALVLSIALRFVPTILDETQKIMNAQRSRGVEFDDGHLLKRMKAIVPILIPLFASALRRADELANAMEARGYQGDQQRTKYRILAWHKKDVIAFLALGCLAFILFMVRQ